MSAKFITSLLPVLLLAACSNPADDVPKAAVSSTNATTETVKTAASDGAGKYYVIGPESSTIEFVGSKVTGKHQGGFRKFAGELSASNGQLAESGGKIVIETDSIYADNDRLTGHLKSPDFFNVAQFPTATFVAKSVTKQATNSLVTGDLTLHGVTRQISFPAKVEVSDTAIDLTADFAINRLDFDIKYPGKPNDLIRKEVVLKIKVRATPGRADFKAVEKTAQVRNELPMTAAR